MKTGCYKFWKVARILLNLAAQVRLAHRRGSGGVRAALSAAAVRDADGLLARDRQRVRVLVASVGKQLHTLNLSNCPELGDGAVLAVAEHCPLLRYFGRPQNASSAAMATYAERCTKTHSYSNRGLCCASRRT
jgi:hypothetical protein